MKQFQGFNEIEAKVRMTMEALSNKEPLEVRSEWIEEAVEQFKSALYKQLKPEDREFGLRASNVGKPLCQLQREQEQAPKGPKEYNDILKMIYGDTIEVLTTLLLKVANVNITSQKLKHDLPVNNTVIPGEDDLWIDGKVYDIKSASSYSFNHKFNEGWNGVYYGDTFGYVDQLYVYAGGDPSLMGGWIVVDKSTGEVRVVEAKPTPEQLAEIKARIEKTERAISNREPFRKVFEEQEEIFYRKPTGNKIVPTPCTFCNYLKTCWPEARLLPQIPSKSENPKPVWYTYVQENP